MTFGKACPAAVAYPAPPPPPPAAPAHPVVRNANDPSGAFTGVAALSGAFAGFLSYSHEPVILPTALAAGVTFLGALVALHVLNLVFRVTFTLGKFAIPAAVILMIGCALDWPWAETAVHYIGLGWDTAVDATSNAWAMWQTR